ncbi:hypothetical protein [Alicyclobacillus ferrooxydans]|uniref:Uncharacterized protein n=1 Tax=Alicyclobacillus ferrooxydans TaxID=471514 RepID=A0A0N8PPZ2_9BACL|nr:hypothetical protein [Alicyclobacillus ferrooxydans]KPV45677.1 hypothetical protein AN477_01865 [Alicyclobacillus ferrooxydans]
MNQDVENVYRTVIGSGGVVFENFPVSMYDGQEFYRMRDEWLVERIETFVPKCLRRAARFDCRLIRAFHEEPNRDPSESESNIMKWLQRMHL